MPAPWKDERDECGWSPGPELRLLGVAMGAALFATAAATWQWVLYDFDFAVGLVLVVWLLMVAFGVVAVVTTSQVRRGRTPTTFEPRDTALAALVAAGSCLALTFLGHVGWVVMAIGLPTASMYLALARMRPGPRSSAAVTVTGAVGLVPFAVWLFG